MEQRRIQQWLLLVMLRWPSMGTQTHLTPLRSATTQMLSKPWWSVNLPGLCRINFIKIINIHATLERLTGAEMLICNTNLRWSCRRWLWFLLLFDHLNNWVQVDVIRLLEGSSGGTEGWFVNVDLLTTQVLRGWSTRSQVMRRYLMLHSEAVWP